MLKSVVKRIKSAIEGLYLYLFGTKQYKKFVVITRSRSGSNLLLTKLDSHPNIEAKGAPFSNLGRDTTESIWNRVFSKKRKHIKRVGFKLFYYHPQDDPDKRVWDKIRKDPSIYLIHLRRKNKLKTYVSWLIAERNNLWANAKEDSINKDRKSVFVDKDDLTKILDRTTNWEVQIDDDFKKHKKLNLFYEDIITNPDIDKQLTSFLELPEHNLTTFIKKQNKESLKELIENFDNLKKEFEGTKYEHLFLLV